jgi:Peptidyl-tRNA hydrolase PTH2
MRMYILIRESTPLGYALIAAAHASLSVYLRYQDTPEMKKWLAGTQNKTICKVSDEEFEKAKLVPDGVVVSEGGMRGAEVALAYKPRERWPKVFQYFRLYW